MSDEKPTTDMSQFDMSKPCGCGRAVRYLTTTANNVGVGACNKYMRCPTYEELEKLAISRYQEIQKLEAENSKLRYAISGDSDVI